MICYKNGNLLDDDSEALVNTVNTVGVMGKGIALMFREKFPENTRAYTKACREGRVQVGSVFPCISTVGFGDRTGSSTSQQRSTGAILRKSNGLIRGCVRCVCSLNRMECVRLPYLR